MEGEDTYSLIFEEALPADTGHYVATVSNVEGTVTTEADLTVNSECNGVLLCVWCPVSIYVCVCVCVCVCPVLWGC